MYIYPVMWRLSGEMVAYELCLCRGLPISPFFLVGLNIVCKTIPNDCPPPGTETFQQVVLLFVKGLESVQGNPL